MLNEFKEDQLSASVLPDWESIFFDLDGECASHRDEVFRHAAMALGRLLAWQVEPFKDSRTSSDEKAQLIMRRTLAAAWVTTPDALGGISAAEVGRRLGVNREAISKHTSEFSRRFGVVSRAQSHGRSGAHIGTLRPIPTCDKPPDSAMRKELDRAAKLGEYQEGQHDA
jgi:hypothetical protein